MPEEAPLMAQIAVYSSTTGEKQYVPEHWMSHPVLSKGLRKTPKQTASDNTKTAAAAEKKES